MKNPSQKQTQHALLVMHGKYAQEIGLIPQIQAVKLRQKSYTHTPQCKVIEFLVAILSGAKHLQDISLSADPLDKDVAVAQAWGYAGWADYSGVSRTLSQLSWEEVRELVAVLEKVSEGWLGEELKQIQKTGQVIEIDGDLTGIPVSNGSRTYPNAAYGHMDAEIRLGYQAGVTSLNSPSYGRLWLSVEHHPGDTVSSTQAEALILAAEKRTGLHPRRRTELLQERISVFEKESRPAEERLKSQRVLLEKAQAAQQETHSQLETFRLDPKTKEERIQSYERRSLRREKAVAAAQERLAKTIRWLQAHTEQLRILKDRLQRFEQENRDFPSPSKMSFRMDAGFGSYDNIALLIEMGYELYTKLPHQKVVQALHKRVRSEDTWTPVSQSAEMIVWPKHKLENCPYPLDIGLERLYTGIKNVKSAALAHFGEVAVAQDSPAWFNQYNDRQTIEAGIKETKQVFFLHHLKVRSEPAIYLQEAMTIFAANYIRRATRWIQQHAQPGQNQLQIEKMGIKRQVHVLAHTSANLSWHSGDILLRFSSTSPFSGKSLHLRTARSSARLSFFGRFLRFPF